MYDERLVRAAQEGDEAAFAALYDRAVDAVYDLCWWLTGDPDETARLVQDAFVLAADNLDVLSDPSQVRPWLLAIAGDRAIAYDEEGTLTSGLASAPVDDAGTEPLAAVALHKWVASATGVLVLPDQFAVLLQSRYGLDDDQLAASAGTTAAQLPALLSRVDDEADVVLGALVVARQGRAACPDLNTMLRDWDTRASVEVAEAVDAHAQTCQQCAKRRRLLDPLALVRDAPMVTAPAELRAAVMEAVAPKLAQRLASSPPISGATAATAAIAGGGGGTAAVPVTARATPPDEPRKIPTAAILTAAAFVALIIAVIVALNLPGSHSPNNTAATVTTLTTVANLAPPPTIAPIDSTTSTPTTIVASAFELDRGEVDMGASATSAVVTLTDASATAADWQATPAADWLVVAPSSGYLSGGQSVRVSLTIDRTRVPQPDFSTEVVFAGTDQGSRSVSVEVVGTSGATTTISPATSTTLGHLAVTSVSASPATIYVAPCALRPTSSSVSADVADPFGTPSVVLTYQLPGEASQSVAMSPGLNGRWQADVTSASGSGTAFFTVTASDSGSSGSASGAIRVASCPAA